MSDPVQHDRTTAACTTGALISRLRPGRSIQGMSAVLLPFQPGGAVDWESFDALLERTVAAGLVPAVNMDTGYAQLIDEPTRERVLVTAARVAPQGFVAGAFVPDQPGATFDPAAQLRQIDRIQTRGGTPVVMPSWGLASLPEADWVDAHARFAQHCERFIAFELGPSFAPNGRIVSLEAYQGLLGIEACVGAKHSSLSRTAEWDRLTLRDAMRPEFRVLTGNDLAIDMVMYGSDYLLGLATFAPEVFAQRDRYWQEQDPRYYELNDRLQALGWYAFRHPVPAYKHSAAQFLQLLGKIRSAAPHPSAPARPNSDVAVLRELARALELLP